MKGENQSQKHLRIAFKALLLLCLASIAVSITCPSNQKDNGLNRCVLLDRPCAEGYQNDPARLPANCRFCAATHKDDGTLTRKCVKLTDNCATGYAWDNTGNTNTNCKNCASGYKKDGTQRCVL